jgi:uncharacterized SAM-binding protein YcdF (DUF218 family)
MPKSRILFFIILIGLLATYVGGCRRAGKWLVKEDVPPHADAIVLLMGNFTDRVLQAADLYNGGKADRLVIVEESMGGYQGLLDRGVSIISHTSQAVSSSVALGVPADSITVLPGDARSTLDEAVIVRNYLKAHAGVDTLILVSSPYHLRRASMIFRKALRETESPVYVGCSGSGAYTSFDGARWWRNKEDIQFVLTEFFKIGSFMMVEKKELKN